MQRYISFRNYLKNELKIIQNVHRKPIGDYGTCQKVGLNKYKIIINNKIDECAAIFTLIHEAAHALCWGDDNHGVCWARAYSKIFKLYLEWLKH